MKKDILIAVIIPVYKRDKELSCLLNSLENLRCKHIHIIVVNNSEFDLSYLYERNESIKIIELSKNYGATAGFNAGIEFAIKDGKYKYLWLLDSDLILEKNCLERLLPVIENDESIGVVGPKIINSVDRGLIVEIGGNIDLNTGNIHPIGCNQPDSIEKKVSKVDYLGSGISLIRSDAIKEVGLMDENYYFLWDDIDYCLRFKKNRYQVVAVSDAVVYHPAFTEKRDQRLSVYYGIRNMLFLISKYGSFINILNFNYITLRKNLKSILYALLNKNISFEKFRFFAFKDFIFNNLGEGIFDLSERSIQKKKMPIELNLSGKEKIILFSNSTSDIIKILIDYIKKKNPKVKVALLCEENRKNIFRNFGFDEIITFNDKKKFLLAYMNLFSRLRKENFDFAINPVTDLELPYQHAFNEVLIWNDENKRFYRSHNNLYSLWKPLLALGLSELLAIIMLPFLSLASFHHRFIKKNNTNYD